jgi:hypothetical protein
MVSDRSLRTVLAVSVFFVVAAGMIAGQETAAAPAVAYTSVSELNRILDQLNETTKNMQMDLGTLRVDRWKADTTTKRQTQANVQSVQRNLQSALPEIIAQLNNSPEDLAASFKLYRNLDALYDVYGSLVESAGAFGSKDEFQNLSTDMSGLESARRSFGERMQRLAAAKEVELARLRTQIKTLQAAPPPPPTKVVVDDAAPPKKPAAKKKPAKPATTGTNPAPNQPPAK